MMVDFQWLFPASDGIAVPDKYDNDAAAADLPGCAMA
jgi:hypothetical protein